MEAWQDGDVCAAEPPLTLVNVLLNRLGHGLMQPNLQSSEIGGRISVLLFSSECRTTRDSFVSDRDYHFEHRGLP